MANDPAGIVLGGAIGLIGGLGGVLIGQLLTTYRGAKYRRIEGLRSVTIELNRLSRLSLQIAQHINIGLLNFTPEELAKKAFDIPGWRECTHELEERNWHFSCMAFLPDAMDNFAALNHQVLIIMDPFSEHPQDPNQRSREEAVLEFNRHYRVIHEKIENRLRRLI